MLFYDVSHNFVYLGSFSTVFFVIHTQGANEPIVITQHAFPIGVSDARKQNVGLTLSQLQEKNPTTSSKPHICCSFLGPRQLLHRRHNVEMHHHNRLPRHVIPTRFRLLQSGTIVRKPKILYHGR
jgi:hypothetical protein